MAVPLLLEPHNALRPFFRAPSALEQKQGFMHRPGLNVLSFLFREATPDFAKADGNDYFHQHSSI
jgi:hypothetical protein